MRKILALLVVAFATLFSSARAQEEQAAEGEGFDVKEVISHHISDSHHWNVITYKGADGSEKSVDIPLPVMAYYKGGFLFAMSSSFDGGQTVTCNGVDYTMDHHDKLLANGSREGVFDFSITRNVASMFMSVVILLLVFIGAAKAIRKTEVPKGAASVAEMLVLFVKDIADDQIGTKKSAKFTPFLLTLFFFIWVNNLIGLVPFFPGSTNLSGNIAFTGILAVFTFLVTHINANGHYWVHTFTVPGVPALMKVIMIPLEILTMFIRPFTLLIRLFANITGGHIIVLSLFCLTYITGKFVMELPSVLLGLMVFVLELIFGALQAYIFTILSALYIGLAVNAGEE